MIRDGVFFILTKVRNSVHISAPLPAIIAVPENFFAFLQNAGNILLQKTFPWCTFAPRFAN
jgi:hypothetical protein